MKSIIKLKMQNNNALDFSIPGPMNCFWSRGPVSADPYINIAYPDTGVFYWSAIFSILEGAKLEIEGQFPHSRYMSFISYDGRGIPQESEKEVMGNTFPHRITHQKKHSKFSFPA